jgi:hypothetical protein
MRNKHVTRFGNPLTTSGALYHVTDQEGLVQMATDLELANRYKEGRTINDHNKEILIRKIRRLQSRYNNTIAEEGIPDNLIKLVKISKKSEILKYCRTLTISEHDLFLFIHNCSLINFIHRSRFPQFVPSHLDINPDDKEKLKKGDFKPFSKKMNSIFLERRNIHVHFFEQGLEWHCFYFSYEDIELGKSNHWKQGCHIHYINHLWPNINKKQVWDLFEVRTTEIRGNVHIRFIPFDYPSSEDVRKSDPLSHGLHSPAAIIFNSNFTAVGNLEPMPVAHILTRGSWTITISTPSM